MQKISPENSFTVAEKSFKKMTQFNTITTSMAMFPPNQNLFNFVVSQSPSQYIRINPSNLMSKSEQVRHCLNPYEVRWISTSSKHGH